MSELLKDPNQFIWVEKYRPQKIDDCILPAATLAAAKGYLGLGRLQTLLLAGKAGTGKTTLAKALCNEIGADWIILNGSAEGGIDTLRTKVTQFASTISFSDAKKVVIIDEADRLSAAFQEAARNFFEEFASNCTFILTCNYKHKIIEPIHSRCATIEFKIPRAEKAELMARFHKRTCQILEFEGVEYKKTIVAELINKYFPDFRRCLNELQKFSVSGRITEDILLNIDEEAFNELVGYLKEKKFTSVRKWAANHVDMGSAHIFRTFYDLSQQKLDPKSIPELILLIARYQYQASMVADEEINLVAFLIEVMMGVSWK